MASMGSVSARWDEKWSPGNFIGAGQVCVEKVGEVLLRMRIEFIDPREFFDATEFEKSGVLAVCAKVFADLDEKLEIAKLCHIARDTIYGSELRSRFWVNANFANEEVARSLFKHCVEEMRYLSEFLPYYYNASKKF